MTLTLDDVRNKRFRMARKSGYEVLEVDEFVDEVEESFAQLVEENQNLKKQVEALKAAPPVLLRLLTPWLRLRQFSHPHLGSLLRYRLRCPAAIVVTTGKEASAAVVRLVEMSTEQAERLVEEATEDANRIREEANRTAHQLTTDARTRAERVESEARVNAERLQADALSRAEKLDREIEGRRGEMFGDLERQRDDLTAAVSALRNFETAYRTNLTTHLRRQIETLESGRAEPVDVPEVASVGEKNSNGTPGQPGRSSLSEKMLQASAVVPATPHASTLCWGTSASWSHIDQRDRARYGGPCVVVTEWRQSRRQTPADITTSSEPRKPTDQLEIDNHGWKFREKSARVVEESAFAAYCLCVTYPFQPCTKKWGAHDHR